MKRNRVIKVPSDMQAGKEHETNCSGTLVIVKYETSKQITVKFLDSGNTKTVCSSQIRKNNIKDIADMSIGTSSETNNYGEIVILEYINACKVGIKFIDTGWCTYTSSSQIRDGTIKDVMRPEVAGVGFYGEGRHKATRGGKIEESYQTWRNMLLRCYCSDNQAENPTYVGCTVLEDWHNFQTFADWFEVNHISGYHLDKDILVKGGKVYSPTTCVFIPQGLNNFLTDRSNYRGLYPTGVHWCKERRKYCSQVSNPFLVGCKRKHLGYYSDPEEAHLVWAEEKLSILKKHLGSGVLSHSPDAVNILQERYEFYVQSAIAYLHRSNL